MTTLEPTLMCGKLAQTLEQTVTLLFSKMKQVNWWKFILDSGKMKYKTERKIGIGEEMGVDGVWNKMLLLWKSVSKG